MKILYPDRVIAYMAESSDAAFPAANLRDDNPKHVWKAASGFQAWTRLHCDVRSGGVAVANTNAISVDVRVVNTVTGTATSTSSGKLVDAAAQFITSGVAAGMFVWNLNDATHTTVSSVDSENQVTLAADIFTSGEAYVIETTDIVSTTAFDLGGVTTYYDLTTGAAFSQARGILGSSVGYEYGYQLVKHDVIITFNCEAVPECGVIRAGQVNTFPDPAYGIKEGLKDYSIVKELNNGGVYVRKRNLVKTFSGQITVERDRTFYDFMRNIIQINGPTPLFWWVSSNLTNQDWTIYGRYTQPPDGSHSYYKHSEISFTIEEVV